MNFNWKKHSEKFQYLKHNFHAIYRTFNEKNGWFVCDICDIKVYVDSNENCSFKNKIMYWENDPFHDNHNTKLLGVVEFNLSCSEIIIKKIIE